MTMLGVSIQVWIVALAGVSFFLLLPSERTTIQRIALVLPTTVLSVFSTPTVARLFSLPEIDHPAVAGFVGLVYIVVATGLLHALGKKNFLSNLFSGGIKAWFRKWIGVSGGADGQ